MTEDVSKDPSNSSPNDHVVSSGPDRASFGARPAEDKMMAAVSEGRGTGCCSFPKNAQGECPGYGIKEDGE